MENLEKINVIKKTGNENILFNDKDIGVKLIDFWKWSVSDLLSNSTRGIFAEFLVATAMGIELSKVREEWDAYDLVTEDGIKIEIKTSAYLQTWFQKTYSNILFSIKTSYFWDAETGESHTEKTRPSDVYVFCVLKHKDKKTVDPLNLNQWEFYVISTKKLNELHPNKDKIQLSSIKQMSDSITYDKIKEYVLRAYIGEPL